ncbi:MAG: 4Fe-4S dicluster domain-containing protein [Planctomycetes bacterium]|nr:4Fe-4S dicluster domain-containing protein [Planctomycetota bacterium]
MSRNQKPMCDDSVERFVAQAAQKLTQHVGDAFYGAAAADDASPQEPCNHCALENDPERNSAVVKNVAMRFGADLAGVCRLNADWLIEPNTIEDLGFREGHTWAVVMAVAMDAGRIRKSPAAARAATRIGYMRMAALAAPVAEFIRNLGFRGVALGNGVALSVPLTCDAGLGEHGRHGMLITPEYGSCVRLCKVFTDLPLAPDKPLGEGPKVFCNECDLCAQACPGNAIDTGTHPSETSRWLVDNDKCRSFWSSTGYGCVTCIAACPLTPNDSTEG